MRVVRAKWGIKIIYAPKWHLWFSDNSNKASTTALSMTTHEQIFPSVQLCDANQSRQEKTTKTAKASLKCKLPAWEKNHLPYSNAAVSGAIGNSVFYSGTVALDTMVWGRGREAGWWVGGGYRDTWCGRIKNVMHTVGTRAVAVRRVTGGLYNVMNGHVLYTPSSQLMMLPCSSQARSDPARIQLTPTHSRIWSRQWRQPNHHSPASNQWLKGPVRDKWSHQNLPLHFFSRREIEFGQVTLPQLLGDWPGKPARGCLHRLLRIWELYVQISSYRNDFPQELHTYQSTVQPSANLSIYVEECRLSIYK